MKKEGLYTLLGTLSPVCISVYMRRVKSTKVPKIRKAPTIVSALK